MTAVAEVLALLQDVTAAHPDDVAEAVRRVGAPAVASALLAHLSPSGALTEVAEGNPELDAQLAEFGATERAIAALREPSLVDRLEDDFALCAQPLADASMPLTAWAIPLLSALAGPLAPLLGFGLTLAIKVALLALTTWAKKRLAKPQP